MAELSKQALRVENNTEFPNNNNGQITPSRLRGFNEDMIDSLVDEISYNADSASWNAQIAALDPSGSAGSINALNAFTASQLIVNSGLNASTASQQTQIDSLTAATASYATSAITASSLVTASFDNGTRNLTFTKGDASTFAVNIPDVSGSSGNFVTTSSFNAYTASTDSSISQLNASSASQQVSINALNANSASVNTSITNINATTASLLTSVTNINSFTSSANQRLTAIESVSGSWITESETGSFATTGSNVFTGIQRFTSEITASNTLINGDLTVLPNTSVKLNGNVDVQNFLYVGAGQTMGGQSSAITWLGSGSIDGTFSASVDARINAITGSGTTNTGSLLVTASAAGSTITFTKGDASTFSVSVDTGSAGTTIYEVVYTGENITKGDPLYISGSQGANPIVYKADASNPAKMPVTFVSAETIGAASTTEAIVLGLIEGIDLTGYTAGQEIYVAEGGGWSTSKPSGSASITQLLGVVTKGGSGGKGLVLNPGPATLPGLDSGKLWVGGANNQPVEITTASFATTGSNQFNGNQTVNGFVSASLGFYSGDNITALTVGEGSNIRFLSGSSYYNVQLVPGVGDIAFSRDGVSNIKTFTLAGATGNSTTFQNNSVEVQSSVPSFTVNAATQSYSGSGNISFTSNNWTLNSLNSQLSTTASFIGSVSVTGQSGGDGKAIMLGHSGSLVLTNSATTPTYSSLSHISSSAANGNTNLIFKTNTNTADTIISSSANIFTNPSAPTAGFKRYMTGGNIAIGGTGAAVPQISGSMAFSPTIANNYFGVSANPLTLRGPVSSSAYNINNNVIAGGGITLGQSAANHFERAVAGLNLNGNLLAGTLSAIANKTTLSASVNIASNIIGGGITLNMDSSSISFSGNSVQGTVTVNNSYFPATTGSQVVTQVNGGLYIGANTIYSSGSNTTFTGAPGRTITNAVMFGANNVISASLNGDNAQVASTSLIGQGLIAIGSNSRTVGASAADWGSVFVGRWNSDLGTKDMSAETVFAVGTGTGTSTRKTGFLIDSGSNTFVEGTLNVSGSTSFTGSLSVLSGSVSGSVITNLTPVSSSLSPVLNIVTMTTAEYALITPNSQTLYVIV
jgi:hypothetical protein